LTTAEVNDAAWKEHPWTYRNNRGCVRSGNRFIRFGIPEPKGKEKPEDKKGGDRIGFDEVVITQEMVGKTVAIFTNIEVKGNGDVLKPGQIDWHNFVLEHGGISEMWYGDGSVIKEKIDI
jgi:hypothetical protein